MLPHAVTLTDQVARQLAEDIRSGLYPVGRKLPSGRELCGRFGVSQAVVREAMQRLRSLGLVEARQGAGCIVRSVVEVTGFRFDTASGLSREELLRVYELRMDLEGAAAARAAVHRTQADLDTLAFLLDALMGNLYDPAEAADLDARFHVAIAAATQNPYYLHLTQYIIVQIKNAVRTARTHTLAQGGRLTEAVHQEHVRIFEAISAGDAESARAMSEAHLRAAAKRLALL